MIYLMSDIHSFEYRYSTKYDEIYILSLQKHYHHIVTTNYYECSL